MKNQSKTIWFKAKSYGWGWYPSSWQGWLIIAAYTVAILVLFLPIEEDATFSDTELQVALCWFTLSTALLLTICYRYGEKPSWRWGDKTKKSPKK